MLGGGAISVPLSEDGDGFSIDLNALENRIGQKTKMIILNSPHNPTGMVIPKQDFEYISNICQRNDLLVLSDEIYEKIVFDGARHYSIASFPGMEDLTITVNGFSKTYSMTGWRLGYVVCSKEIMSKMQSLQQHTVTHPTSFVEQAGVTAIHECANFVDDMVREYRANRDFFVEGINNLKIFECAKPKGAFYAFPKITSCSSSLLADILLERARVLCVPGQAFGKFGENHLRFVYSQPREVLAEALDQMKLSIDEIKSSAVV